MSLLSEKLQARGVEISKRSKAGKALTRAGVPQTAELSRILALPRRVLDFDKVEDLTPLYVRTDVKCSGCYLCRKGPAKILPVQSAMLWEAHVQDGLFASVAAGAGKTLAALLAHDALAATRTVLLVKPSLKRQLLDVDVPMYGRHFQIPAIWTTDDPLDCEGVYVVAYSELSSATSADILDQIKPDLVVSDECHSIARKSSARTKRFLRFMRDNPGCRFAGMSGTVAKRSLLDYSHLVELALRKNSPLPYRYTELQDWSAAIDLPEDDPNRMPPGKLLQLCNEGENVRQGYRRRLIETPGVVATHESAIGTSLVIDKHAPAVPEAIEDAIDYVDRLWKWQGEELSDAIAKIRTTQQLSQGLYLKWDWPGEPDTEWLEARREWHREIRKYLNHAARPGMDSPLLLANAAAAGRWKSQTWPAWALVKDRPEPPTVPVWLSEFFCASAVRWSETAVDEDAVSGGAIIWYSMVEVGKKIAELGGFPFYGAGDNHVIHADAPVIVCSIQAHGTGKNLQGRYSRNLIAAPCPNGRDLEQLVARSHRPGQEADEVVCAISLHSEAFEASWKRALSDAEYLEDSTNQQQKILMASRTF
jgi:hypothetical protein